MARATGGTITTSGAYTLHTFDASGTFTTDATLSSVPTDTVDEDVIGGGGGGGGGAYASGAGAGRYVRKTGVLLAPSTPYAVVIGAAGPGGANGANGTAGGDSTFNGLTAKGGGFGAFYTNHPGGIGGSSGGGAANSGSPGTPVDSNTGGGNSYGNSGGTGSGNSGAGGGGAGGAGADGAGSPTTAPGGIGLVSLLDGNTYAAGGAGATNSALATPGANPGDGGAGGGPVTAGGAGHAGRVIIRYLTAPPANAATVVLTASGAAILATSAAKVTSTVALTASGAAIRGGKPWAYAVDGNSANVDVSAPDVDGSPGLAAAGIGTYRITAYSDLLADINAATLTATATIMISGAAATPQITIGDVIPLVANAAARDALYPAPGASQRVQRVDIEANERYIGGQWIVDPPGYAWLPGEVVAAVMAGVNPDNLIARWPPCDVRRYGADITGTVSSLAAFRAAAAVTALTLANPNIPPGDWKLEGTTRFTVNGTHVRTGKERSSRFHFSPDPAQVTVGLGTVKVGRIAGTGANGSFTRTANTWIVPLQPGASMSFFDVSGNLIGPFTITLNTSTVLSFTGDATGAVTCGDITAQFLVRDQIHRLYMGDRFVTPGGGHYILSADPLDDQAAASPIRPGVKLTQTVTCVAGAAVYSADMSNEICNGSFLSINDVNGSTGIAGYIVSAITDATHCTLKLASTGANAVLAAGATIVAERHTATVEVVTGSASFNTPVTFVIPDVAVFEFSDPNKGILSYCSFEGGSFIGEDNTNQKIAIDLKDTSKFDLGNIYGESTDSGWTGFGSGGANGSINTPSIGKRTTGREFLTTGDVSINADRPVQFRALTGAENTSIDHFKIGKLLLGIGQGTVRTTGLITMSGTSTGYARATGSFLADGFLVGMSIAGAGFAAASGNNGTPRSSRAALPNTVITAVSALTITCPGCSVDAAAAGRSLTFVSTESGVLIDPDAAGGNFSIAGLSANGGRNAIWKKYNGGYSGVIQGVNIEEMRYEQPANFDGHSVRWEAQTTGLKVEDTNLGGVGNAGEDAMGGAYLRNVIGIVFESTQYSGGGGWDSLTGTAPGTGVVSCTAGAAVFSRPQPAAVMIVGMFVTIAGPLTYTVTAVADLQHCTLSGAPTFTAQTFGRTPLKEVLNVDASCDDFTAVDAQYGAYATDTLEASGFAEWRGGPKRFTQAQIAPDSKWAQGLVSRVDGVLTDGKPFTLAPRGQYVLPMSAAGDMTSGEVRVTGGYVSTPVDSITMACTGFNLTFSVDQYWNGVGLITSTAGAAHFDTAQIGMINGALVKVGSTTYTVSAYNASAQTCTLSGAPTFGYSAFTQNSIAIGDTLLDRTTGLRYVVATVPTLGTATLTTSQTIASTPFTIGLSVGGAFIVSGIGADVVGANVRCAVGDVPGGLGLLWNARGSIVVINTSLHVLRVTVASRWIE